MSRTFNATSSVLTRTSGFITAFPFTIAGWLYTTNEDKLYLPMFCDISTAGADSIYVVADTSFNPSHFAFGIVVSGGSYRASASGLVTNAWNHLCARCTGGDMNQRNAVCNGDIGNMGVGEDFDGATIQTYNNRHIGAIVVGGEYHDGQIAHVAVWNVGLTDDEVVALSKGASPLLIRPDSLTFYAPLTNSAPGVDLIGGGSLADTATSAGTSEPRMTGPVDLSVGLAEAAAGSNTNYNPPSVTLVVSGAAPLVNPQYARPSADTATVGNWTKSGGSTYYENIDEAVRSDSDYIVSGINPSADEIVIKLATISDPGTDNGFHIQWAAGATGTTGQVTGTLVYDYTGTPVTIQAFVHAGLPVGSVAEFDDAVSPANVANIADFSKLYFKIKAD